MECFKAHFRNFPIDSKHFKNFLEILWFPKILSLESFANSWGNFCIYFFVITFSFLLLVVKGNCTKMWKSLQIYFPWLSKNFCFSLKFFENVSKHKKRSFFCRKKLKTLYKYCPAWIELTFSIKFVIDAKLQRSKIMHKF